MEGGIAGGMLAPCFEVFNEGCVPRGKLGCNRKRTDYVGVCDVLAVEEWGGEEVEATVDEGERGEMEWIEVGEDVEEDFVRDAEKRCLFCAELQCTSEIADGGSTVVEMRRASSVSLSSITAIKLKEARSDRRKQFSGFRCPQLSAYSMYCQSSSPVVPQV